MQTMTNRLELRTLRAILIFIFLAMSFNGAQSATIKVKKLNVSERNHIRNVIKNFRNQSRSCNGIQMASVSGNILWHNVAENVEKRQARRMASNNKVQAYGGSIKHRLDNAVSFISVGATAELLFKGSKLQAINQWKTQGCEALMNATFDSFAVGRAVRNNTKFWALVLFDTFTFNLIQPDLPRNYRLGWVWANHPKTKINRSYTPHSAYQYHHRFDRREIHAQPLPHSPIVATQMSRQAASRPRNSITRLDVGEYRVDFPGFQRLPDSNSNDPIDKIIGTVHVTAFGGNHHCKTLSRSASTKALHVNVGCFAPDGAFTNGRFTVLVYKDGKKPTRYGNAYIGPNLSPALSYNSRNTKSDSPIRNQLKRLETGRYEVRLPNMQRHQDEAHKGGTVLVTARDYGPERCKVVGWKPNGKDILAYVNCFDPEGNRTDSQFTLSFMREPGVLAIHVAGNKKEAMYAWHNAAPTPHGFYQSDAHGNAVITSENPSTGVYFIELPGVKHRGSSTVQVTPYGRDNHYCNVMKWREHIAGNGTEVQVNCYDNEGRLANGTFTLLYYTDQPLS